MEIQFSGDKSPPRTKVTVMSAYERELLMRLVSSHMDIVTSRQTDFATIRKKKRVWQEIVQQFCDDEATTKRTSVQLKKAWENLKARSKHKVTGKKCFKPIRYDAPSGPSPVSTQQQEEQAISFLEPQEPQPYEAGYSPNDKPAKASDYDAVEHNMRMKILTMKHDVKEKLWKREMQMKEEEHRMKMRVYEAQLLYYQNVLGGTVLQNPVQNLQEEPLLIIHDNQ